MSPFKANQIDNTLEMGQIGGERNTSSSSNNYDATKHECNSTILTSVITAQALSGGAPAFLMGIHLNAPLTGNLTITGFTNFSGAATDWVILSANATAAGALLPPGNARICSGGLSATLSNAADYGKVIVDWRLV